MDILKKYLPHAFKADNTNDLIMALVIYIVVLGICGLVIGLLAKIPIVGILFSILGAVVGIYGLAGVVLTLLVFFKIIKD